MDDRERMLRAFVAGEVCEEGMGEWECMIAALSIIDAERARADMAVEDLALATRVKDNLRALARDLAGYMRQTYAMLAMHHIDMTKMDALLARAAAILEAPRGK